MKTDTGKLLLFTILIASFDLACSVSDETDSSNSSGSDYVDTETAKGGGGTPQDKTDSGASIQPDNAGETDDDDNNMVGDDDDNDDVTDDDDDDDHQDAGSGEDAGTSDDDDNDDNMVGDDDDAQPGDDCETIGCSPPVICENQCESPCGCCLCAEGESFCAPHPEEKYIALWRCEEGCYLVEKCGELEVCNEMIDPEAGTTAFARCIEKP